METTNQAPVMDTTKTGNAPQTSDQPARLGDLCEQILARPFSSAPSAPSLEQQAKQQRHECWQKLIQAIGARYRSCRLENFHCANQAMKEAIGQLTELAEHVREHVESGGNLILYGPPGTGKDHLQVALLLHAIKADLSVEWINGQDLYGQLRDRIDTETTEDRSVRQFCKASVLAISDPVPPKGEVSSYSATMLYRIVDRRYREMRSTWVTVNVGGAAEAEKELTGPIFDRLRDNCVSVCCDWPSFRSQRKPAWMEAK